MNKFKLNSRGISVIEGLACLAILAIMVLSLVPMFTSQMSVIKLASSSGLCRSYLSNIVARIDKLKVDPSGTRGIISPVGNFGSTYANPSVPLPILKIPSLLSSRFSKYGATALYVTNPSASLFGGTFTVTNNGITNYTPLLLDGPLASLADLYNFSGYAAEAAVPTTLHPSGIPSNYTASFRMKLEPFSLNDGSAYSPTAGTKFWPRPRNSLRSGVPTTEPYTDGNFLISQFPGWMTEDHGIRVYLTGTLTDAVTGAVETCDHKKEYSYAQDLHNAMDFTSDFKILNLNGITKTENNIRLIAEGEFPLNNRTRDLSNKNSTLFAGSWSAGQGLRPDLRTIFTNLAHNQSTGLEDSSGASDAGNNGRQRPMCSQNHTTPYLNGFYLKFRVYDLLTKEPGAVPLCMDTSNQWLQGEVANGGWCMNNHKGDGAGGNSSVRIIYDWKPRQTGWVPCEQLSFCGEKPDAVNTVTGNDGRPYFEYQFQYDGIIANTNPAGSKHQRLWGCELKFAIAAVDPAGNLVYPPQKQILTPTPGIESVPPRIKEVVPKVYFKPPPCYACDCNRCPKKKGKGGILGNSFFRAFTVAIGSYLLYSTGGALGLIAGSLGGACISGGLGCESGSTTSYTAGTRYTSCNGKVDDGCTCGYNCQRRDPPGPNWSDTLSVADNETDILNCDPTTIPVSKGSTTFNVKLAGKTLSGTMASYDMKSQIAHGTEVAWKQFFPQTGKLCTANFICMNGVWEDGAQFGSYSQPNGKPLGKGDLNNCFEVRTAYKPTWSTNPVTAEFKKPDKGVPQCLEVNFNKIPFNDTYYSTAPDTLWSSTVAGNDTTAKIAECGAVIGNTGVVSADFAPLATPLDPSTRAFGKSAGFAYPDDCATDETIVMPDKSTRTIKIGYPEAITDTNAVMPPKTGPGSTPTKDPNGNLIIPDPIPNRPDNIKPDSSRPDPTKPDIGKVDPTAGPGKFKCWKRCDTPGFAPSGPLKADEAKKDPFKSELKYYEKYNPSTDSGLPFCTIDTSLLDN